MLVKSGVAAGVSMLSETSVNGYVDNGTGRVTSTTYKSTRFSLIQADGFEMPIDFPSHNIHIRDGNRLSVIYVGDEKLLAGIVNHDTRGAWAIEGGYGSSLVYKLGLVKPIGCLIYVLAFIAWIVGINMIPRGMEDTAEQTIIWTMFMTLFIPLTVAHVLRHRKAAGIYTSSIEPAFNKLCNSLRKGS